MPEACGACMYVGCGRPPRARAAEWMRRIRAAGWVDEQAPIIRGQPAPCGGGRGEESMDQLLIVHPDPTGLGWLAADIKQVARDEASEAEKGNLATRSRRRCTRT